MKTFNHAFTFPFEVVTTNPDEEVTPDEMRLGILAAVSSLTDLEILEACGMPFDTFTVGE